MLFLDTAADVTVISANTVNHLGLYLSNDRCTFYAADGSEMMTMGMAFADLDVLGQSFWLLVVVVAPLHTSCLLGLDVLTHIYNNEAAVV